MNVLFVIPHITLFRPEGHLHRLTGVVSLFSDCQINFLVPRGADTSSVASLPSVKDIFYFNEPGIFKTKIPYFLDYSKDFKYHLQKVIDSSSPDLIIFDFPWGLNALKDYKNSKLVYLSHGVERDFAVNTLRHFRINYYIFRKIFTALISYLESRSCKNADIILTISEKDKLSFEKYYNLESSKIFFLPQPSEIHKPDENKTALRALYNLPADKFLIIFHGSFSHNPNREAVKLITDKIAPAIAGLNPDILFVIAGTGQPVYRTDNLYFVGFIESIKDLISACDLAIVPLTTAFGAQMKLLDYLSCGVPVVTTSCGAQGYNIEKQECILITENTAEGVTDGIMLLERDSCLREKLAKNGKNYIEEKFNINSIRKELRGWIK